MKKGHIAICGTGRAGTTLLVKIFHAAGLDTGFSDTRIKETLSHISKAGLERVPTKLHSDTLPDVIKTPKFFEGATVGLSEGWLKVDQMIIPMRNIDDVLQSRRRVTQRTFFEYFMAKGLRGGFVGGPKNLFSQRKATLDLFFQNVFLAVEHQIPITFLSFPRFAQDENYFIKEIGPVLMANRGIDEAILRRAHRSETNTDLVRSSGKK